MAFRFFHTLNSRPAQPDGPGLRLGRFLKHVVWQVRKRWGGYPKRLSFGESFLWIRNPQVADACGSLVNLFGYYDGNLHLLKKLRDYGTGREFIDVGANAGVYTVAGSEGGAFKVHAFEAHPATFALLRENVSGNGRDNVVLENAAVSDAAGFLRFSDLAGSPVNHVMESGEAGGIEVPAIRLDDYAARLGLRPVGMKVDVEGHEVPVLRGAERILKDSVQFVFLEENHPGPLLSYLSECGFEGPYYFHPAAGCLSRRALREDAVFLKPACREWLERNGVPMEGNA